MTENKFLYSSFSYKYLSADVSLAVKFTLFPKSVETIKYSQITVTTQQVNSCGKIKGKNRVKLEKDSCLKI